MRLLVFIYIIIVVTTLSYFLTRCHWFLLSDRRKKNYLLEMKREMVYIFLLTPSKGQGAGISLTPLTCVSGPSWRARASAAAAAELCQLAAPCVHTLFLSSGATMFCFFQRGTEKVQTSKTPGPKNNKWGVKWYKDAEEPYQDNLKVPDHVILSSQSPAWLSCYFYLLILLEEFKLVALHCICILTL